MNKGNIIRKNKSYFRTIHIGKKVHDCLIKTIAHREVGKIITVPVYI